MPKPKFEIVCFLLAMTVCNAALALRVLPMLRKGYQDFTIFYTAGLLLRNHQAAHLYDLKAQYQTQLDFAHVPTRQGPLPFNHPPFEALLFVPLSRLSYWPAYVLWTVMNCAMLAASVVLLRGHFPQLAALPPVIVALAATAFFPVAIGIVQGQDMILLLLLFAMAIISLDRGKDALGGAFLGACLFRPQLAVPLTLLLAARRWRVLAGFAPVAVALAALCVAIGGWRGPYDYVRFLIHLEGTGARAYGSNDVPNLRGLIANLPWIDSLGVGAGVIIAVCSLAVFLIALRRLRQAKDPVVHTSNLAAVTAVLVSFHALDYDLSLLLPAALFLLARTCSNEDAQRARRRKIGTRHILLFLLLFSPLYMFLWLEAGRFFLFALILVWFFVKLIATPASTEIPI